MITSSARSDQMAPKPIFSSYRTRIALSIVVVLAAVGGVRLTIQAATALKIWNAGETLTAADLNENFRLLQTQITQLQGNLVPPGTVVAFAGPVVPGGWLLCDGTKVERAKYPDLFSAIGTVHGSGDGASTFNLPDYRGMFLRGVDMKAGRDPDAVTRMQAAVGGNVGDVVGSVESFATGAPKSALGVSTEGAHMHNLVGGLYKGSGASIGSFPGGTPFLLQASTTDVQGAHGHTVTGGDKETRPVNASVNYIIKS
jgi:microcystin-dependent protein